MFETSLLLYVAIKTAWNTSCVLLHSMHVVIKCTSQKLLKLAAPNSNIRLQTDFGDSNPGPEKNLNFTSLVVKQLLPRVGFEPMTC